VGVHFKSPPPSFKQFRNLHFLLKQAVNLKFGDGDGPNLCKVKKVDVSSTFIENIFRSGLTLVSSNDIITIKIDKKNLIVKNHKKINKQKRLFKKNLGCQMNNKGNELRL